MSENDKATGDDNDVREGDHREGVGGMRVRVEVLKIRGDVADCRLTRSGQPKELKMRTLRTAYRLVSRGPVT